MKESVLIVIPARAGSTRFPNKPLALVRGRSLIERVWKSAKVSGVDGRVVIATDNDEIIKAASSFGAEAVLSSTSCRTGSDRVFQVAGQIAPQAEVIVSLQGDAVLTPPWIIKDIISVLLSDPSVQIATSAILLRGKAREDFLCAKKNGSSTGTTVVFDSNRNALYFSKAVIPRIREGENGEIFRHIGIYAYRREALARFAALEQSMLEKAEGLEQLRALENGIPIRVIEVDYRNRTHASIDNPEDIAVVEEIIQREGEIVEW